MASSSPSQASISEICQACSSGFDNIISALLDPSRTPSWEAGRFAKLQSRSTFLSAVEDCRGRFRVWSFNLGAHQPVDSQKSLDFRLRDAPRMRDSVVRVLHRLVGMVARASVLTADDSSIRSIKHITLDSEGDGPTDELSATSLGIRSCLDHLFSISILIRRQRPKGRLPSTTSGFVPVESSLDITGVWDKFPKVRRETPWLAQRLGNAIGQRRHVIQYRQEHRQNLADISRNPETLKADAKSTIATTFVEHPNSANDQVSLADKRTSFYTFATSFMSSRSQDVEIGHKIPDLDRLVLDGVQLAYGTPFECPYCRTIQMARNQVEWRRHVFSDLQTYICTFEYCPTSTRLFPTRREWMEHELAKHRRRWVCIFCNPRVVEYDSEEQIKHHLQSLHTQSFIATQQDLILEACERNQHEFPRGSCPLCDEWDMPRSDVTAPASRDAKRFYRHLGHHLQHLALEALPLHIEGLDVEDVSNESEAEGRSQREWTDDSDNGSAGPSEADGANEAEGTDEIDKNSMRGSLERYRTLSLSSLHASSLDIDLVPAETSRTVYDVADLRRGSSPISWRSRGEESDGWAETAAQAIWRAAGDERHVDAGSKARLREVAKLQEEEDPRKTEKAPIRFKDAVGRKFSLPFHLVQTWEGMEDLVKQAFLHLDHVIVPHVQEGHYDLVGPNREIILPSVWEKVIEPGWSITMHMWPMDEAPPLRNQPPKPPAPRELLPR
ncbi:hypothetical protein B0H66DRAFT_382716 [Apodospora peruviana]|uniref:C2H2-type domain-containing protein n=1 Tax=Apodospora peruviana TaxID=516989 RepID=A0AAE0HU27_9PEZI|nr:hypothetical protein B0H66DRAFT_382716 [Apodospora peruviana]